MLVINIIFPIFLMVFLGWSLRRFNFLPAETSKYLMLFLFWVSAPAIIFSSIVHYHAGQIFVWHFWVAYPLTVAITTLLCYFIFKKGFRETAFRALSAGFAASIKNTIMIGFPILLGIFGKTAVIPMAITVLVVNCVVTPMLIAAFEYQKINNRDENRVLRTTFLATAKNPLVISAFLGIFLSLFNFTLPAVINNFFNSLAASYIPCALLAVGIDLNDFKISEDFPKALTITFINLILSPLIGLLVARLMGLTPFYAISLIIFSAVPTAKTIYVYLKKYDVFAVEAAAIISLTTILSVFTIPLFMFLCYELWPSVFKF